MPRFNGTGPLGQGPMTGRGMGFCMLKESKDRPGLVEGLAGIQGTPVANPYFLAPYSYGLPYVPVRPLYGRGFGRLGFGRGFGRGRGRGRGIGRFGFWW
jgi:hypothetical protein